VIRRVLLFSGGVFLLLGLGGVVVARAVRTASVPVQPAVTVRCDEIAGGSKSGEGGGYRVVLGIVSAPPVYLGGNVVRDPYSAPFPYWEKAGIAIRAGTAAVTVSLPKEWRNRARIRWGAPGSPATVLRLAPCPSTVETWSWYAGGFLLRSSSACVPLTFAVGNRRATLRFGVGRHC
jgi:hypothetical protein